MHRGCITEFLCVPGALLVQGMHKEPPTLFRTCHLVHFYYLLFWEAKVKLVLFPPMAPTQGGGRVYQSATDPRTSTRHPPTLGGGCQSPTDPGTSTRHPPRQGGRCQSVTKPRTFPVLQRPKNARQSPLPSDFRTFVGALCVCVVGGCILFHSESLF